jgi:hypothetical protein
MQRQIINEAIAAYLGIENGATVPDRVSQVENALAELQQQVGTILGKFQRDPVTPIDQVQTKGTKTPARTRKPVTDDSRGIEIGDRQVAHDKTRKSARSGDGMSDSYMRQKAKSLGWLKGCGESVSDFMGRLGWRKVGLSNEARWFKDKSPSK